MRGLLVLVLLGALLFFVSADVGIYTDYLWYQSQGVEAVFLTVLGFEARYGAMFGVVALLFLAVNLAVAQRLARSRPTLIADVVRYPWATVQLLGWLILPASALLALLFAAGAASQWRTISLAFTGVTYQVKDPMLGNDVAFYVFRLPFYQFLLDWTTTLLVVTGLVTVGLYLVAAPGNFDIDPQRGRVTFEPPRALVAHAAVFVTLILLVRAVSSWVIAPANLLLGHHRVASGALFTDVNVRYPAYRVVAVVLVLAAGLSLLAVFQRRPQRGIFLLMVAPALWLTGALIALWIVPSAVQAIVVQPTELQRETPFILHNLDFTRRAFALDQIKVEEHKVAELTASDIAANPETISNTRLWDVRPLLLSYQQLQGLRPYYVFSDVDVDRYSGRQVMLSARELDLSKLPSQAQNWVNEHFSFTHGFGVVSSTVTDSQGQGQPDFLLSDIPPKASYAPLDVTKPQIYFSEHSYSWIIVGTSIQDGEFDFPQGDGNAHTQYSGRAGVPIGSTIRRMMFAWKFADVNILLTTYLTDHSKIIFDHAISQVVTKIAPYLQLDGDPYIVISQGKLYWMWDAYTVSDSYPYATGIGNGTNYMRNSVKIVIDAYDGTTTFYRTDSAQHPEPILDAYSKLFPGLYQPLSDMPADLRTHIRYPEDLFQAQAALFATYHITDPQVLYNREDVWTLPNENQGGTQSQLLPYYVTLRLPGSSAAEFLLMEPFVPQGKQNMIAWITARSDPEHYGELLAYKFSKDTLIFGPQQIEARIDQDPTISANLSLWNQQGSRVQRGNLLVMPVGDSFLYVEPLFLQAESSKIPELKRVILGTSNRIVIANSLKEGLDSLFGPSAAFVAPAVATTAPASAGGVANPDAARLAQDALDHYNRAQEKLKANDWAGYGAELAAMEADLKALAGK